MKKILISIIIAVGLFVTPMLTIAQQTSPSDPGGNPEAGTPLGGGAPIGGGLFILLGLGAAYGGNKLYHLFDEDKEELES